MRCAAKLRPDFADAQRVLATAEERAESSEAGNNYVSLPTRESIPRTVNAEINAIDKFNEHRFERPPQLMANLAFDILLKSLVDRDHNEIIESVRWGNEAFRAYEGVGDASTRHLALVHLNLGLALLASGDFKGAHKAYEAAIKAYEAAIKEEDRPSQKLIFSALSDLETLATLCSGIADDSTCSRIKEEADNTKQELMGGIQDPQNSTTDPAAQVDSFEASADADNLFVRVRLNRPTRKGELWIVWYQKDTQWNSWRVLPGASGPLLATPGPDVQFRDERSYLRGSSGLTCLPQGGYRAELFDNGKKVAPIEPGMGDAALCPQRA